MAVKINIDGERELLAALRKLDKSLVADLKAVHKDAAEVVVTEAKRRVPVRSGKLKGTLRAMAGAKYGRAAAGTKSLPYAGAIHFGWATRPDPEKRWRGGPIKPNPFIYDAADARRGDVLGRYRSGVDKLIRKADLNP